MTTPPRPAAEQSGKGEQVKRGLTVAVAGAAILVAGISGCSKSSSGGSGASSGAGGRTGPTVIIDGKNQDVTGSVTCQDAGSVVSLAIAGGMTGIEAVVSKDDPPAVTSVALNYPGVILSYPAGGAGSVSATKNGSSYQIKGTATGTDQVTKPFEIDLTCS
jgi:ipoprotein LpqH